MQEETAKPIRKLRIWASRELRSTQRASRKTRKLRGLLKALDDVEHTDEAPREGRAASRLADPRRHHSDWSGPH